MKVRLNAENQYLPNGPEKGAIGELLEIRKVADDSGDEWLAFVHFYNYTGTYWVVLEHLMRADTSNTHTYWTTL